MKAYYVITYERIRVLSKVEADDMEEALELAMDGYGESISRVFDGREPGEVEE